MPKHWCPIRFETDKTEMCDDDCMDCLEFLTTCDKCHDAGHTDSHGWVRQPDGKIYCWDCDDTKNQTLTTKETLE